MAERDRPTDPADTLPADIGETVLPEPDRETAAQPDVTDDFVREDAVAPPPPPVRSRSGFLPAFAGGVVAAGLGFALSHFDVLGLAPATTDLSGLTERLSQVEASATATAAELGKVQAALPTTKALADRIAALETAPAGAAAGDPRVDELIARMDALEGQLAQAAQSGSGVSGAALSALQAQVDALKSAGPAASTEVSDAVKQVEARLAETEARAQALADEAQTMSAAARTALALGQLRAALDTGQPFSGALSMLEGAEVPADLADRAETGLPTLHSLQASFPDAARAALEVALRSNMGEGWSDRVTAFLRSQTGARALTPRDGNDPDAILSRAEAALTRADLETALTEIAALPPDAQAAMADWVAQAQTRRAAAAAIEALAARTGG